MNQKDQKISKKAIKLEENKITKKNRRKKQKS